MLQLSKPKFISMIPATMHELSKRTSIYNSLASTDYDDESRLLKLLESIKTSTNPDEIQFWWVCNLHLVLTSFTELLIAGRTLSNDAKLHAEFQSEAMQKVPALLMQPELLKTITSDLFKEKKLLKLPVILNTREVLEKIIALLEKKVLTPQLAIVLCMLLKSYETGLNPTLDMLYPEDPAVLRRNFQNAINVLQDYQEESLVKEIDAFGLNHELIHSLLRDMTKSNKNVDFKEELQNINEDTEEFAQATLKVLADCAQEENLNEIVVDDCMQETEHNEEEALADSSQEEAKDTLEFFQKFTDRAIEATTESVKKIVEREKERAFESALSSLELQTEPHESIVSMSIKMAKSALERLDIIESANLGSKMEATVSAKAQETMEKLKADMAARSESTEKRKKNRFKPY